MLFGILKRGKGNFASREKSMRGDEEYLFSGITECLRESLCGGFRKICGKIFFAFPTLAFSFSKYFCSRFLDISFCLNVCAKLHGENYTKLLEKLSVCFVAYHQCDFMARRKAEFERINFSDQRFSRLLFSLRPLIISYRFFANLLHETIISSS